MNEPLLERVLVRGVRARRTPARLLAESSRQFFHVARTGRVRAERLGKLLPSRRIACQRRKRTVLELPRRSRLEAEGSAIGCARVGPAGPAGARRFTASS